MPHIDSKHETLVSGLKIESRRSGFTGRVMAGTLTGIASKRVTGGYQSGGHQAYLPDERGRLWYETPYR